MLQGYCVTHNEDNANWQFLDGKHVFEEDRVLVCLGEWFSSIPDGELADLPQGWYAWRTTADGPWQRAQAGEPLRASLTSVAFGLPGSYSMNSSRN